MCSALTPSGSHLDLSTATEPMTLWSPCTLHVRAEAYVGIGDERTVCGRHPYTRIQEHYCCFLFF